jgi:acid phosphatase class B
MRVVLTAIVAVALLIVIAMPTLASANGPPGISSGISQANSSSRLTLTLSSSKLPRSPVSCSALA